MTLAHTDIRYISAAQPVPRVACSATLMTGAVNAEINALAKGYVR